LELAVDAERGRICFCPRQVDVADAKKPAEAHVRAGIEVGAEVPVERVVIDNAADVARAGGQAADENGARASRSLSVPAPKFQRAPTRNMLASMSRSSTL
jgi:hypothetical protein